MSKLKQLFLNKGSSFAYAAITAIFTIVPESFFKYGFIQCNLSDTMVVVTNRLIVCVVIFTIANIIYHCYRKHRSSVVISEKTYTIQIEYGNIFDTKSGKKVINFDECFSTNVGNKPEDIKLDSVCGQYLKKYPINDMSSLIKALGIKSLGKSSFGNKDCYVPGTIIQRNDFLLMAFAKLDKEGRGYLTYEQYLDCLDKLWEQIDLYHGTDDVYLPVLGSRITRFNKELTQQELLDIMIASYRLSPKRLRRPNTLHIICKEREGFSLNDVFGVD